MWTLVIGPCLASQVWCSNIDKVPTPKSQFWKADINIHRYCTHHFQYNSDTSTIQAVWKCVMGATGDLICPDIFETGHPTT